MPSGHKRPLRRRLRKGLPYAIAVGVIGLFTISLLVFLGAYDTDSDASDAKGPGDPGRSAGATPGPSGSASPSGSRGTTGSPSPSGSGPTLPKTLGRLTITPGGGGGFTYKNLPTHRIVLRVTSTTSKYSIGYLVPTSPDHSYGRVARPGRSWSVSTTGYGKPYYAAVFIQVGPSGVATCEVEIDGQVAQRKSTSGQYGRQVCTG